MDRDWDKYFIELAEHVATMSTCLHRHQGAVLVKDRHILATGYNGSPPGQKHCDTDFGFCAKEKNDPCRAEGCHGESNAIAWAARIGIPVEGATLYTIYSPCLTCCNLIAVAGIKEVRYKDTYSGFTEGPYYLETLGIRSYRIGV